jgi:hypothetical protein
MSTIVALPNNASKWQMGFNSAFKGLSVSGGAVGCETMRYQPEGREFDSLRRHWNFSFT